MKTKNARFLTVVAMLIMALLLAACGSNEPEPAPDPTPEPVEAAPEEEMEEEEMEEEMEEDPMTVGDIAMADDTFTMLVDAVLATGLDTVVQGDDPITVFAPTNEAFEALPEGLLDSLTEDQLRDVLTYHVVPGRVLSTDVAGMDMGTSALGEMFDVTVDGDTIMINDATIIAADIEGSNGIIHVIDTVLIPPSMMAQQMEFNAIFATSNPGELANDAIVSIAPDFSETLSSVTSFADGVTSVESLALTTDGVPYLTVDLGEGSGAIVTLADLGDMSPEALTLSADLTAPKGLYIAEGPGVVLVADFGGNAIAAYDLALNPLFTITDFGDAAGSVWDVYHDAASDTLFATGTDGSLIVYDDFAGGAMGADGPSRIIVPSDADGNKISVNLHGVWYDSARDELILTDVGDAGSAEDGALFVIPDASTAEGNTTVSVLIAGPQSMLGNPVDVVFDGVSAYVAEKSNDAILRFDNILAADMMGMMGDAAPSASFELAKAESVWLTNADVMMSDMGEMDDMMTVGDIAMADDTFSMLVNAVLATGLDTVVQGDDPITVFAPTNEAFEALPEGLLESLTEDQLRDVLTYHVVPGRVLSTDVMGMDMGTSALGETFDITVDGDTIMINDATIIAADIEGSNGIIHVIDTVLIPPSMMGGSFNTLYATSNPGELENDAIVSLAPDFSETFSTITDFADGVTSVESIVVTTDGTKFLTVDLGEGAGAIAGLTDLGNMSPEALMLSADLTAPKGLYVAEEVGVVLVADFGGNAIAAYNSADLAPLFTITDFGDATGSVWDVYHDADSDTLFATGTDGSLIVYDNFAGGAMGAEGPSRIIVPADADGNKISINLHGVWYDAATDSLLLTDVGDAGSAEDGQMFVISDASTAEGNTTVTVQVGGAMSMLGNPVDLVFDGSSAYIAEKSNDAILRFDSVLAESMMGMMGDAAPSAVFELAKAESVWLGNSDMDMAGMEGDMMTVGDIAMADDTFSMLVNAVLATGLDTVVQGDEPITVFAPTNAAFEALPEGLLESLTEDQLRDVLSYHVVPGLVYAEDVMGMDMGTSALGETFTITVDGDTIMINDATIISADIEGSNGIIHVIDTVLIPPSMSN